MSDEDLDFFEKTSQPEQQGEEYKNHQHLPQSPDPEISEKGGVTQWTDAGGGIFIGTGATKTKLPAGVYRVAADKDLLFIKQNLITDELVELPDSASKRVMESIEKFWNSKEQFAIKHQIYKRGILLHGPAGSGKSALIAQLIRDLIAKDGVVIYSSSPVMAAMALQQLRRVEPERNLICVMEDLDEIVRSYGEHTLLSLLDGQMQISNIVFLATSNYPELLAKRIVNRPSRFDMIVKIGMPSAASREAYLRSKMSENELPKDELARWVTDTKGLSMAHLRELIVSTFCLGNTYEDTITRLHKMERAINANDGRKMGF